MEKLKKKYKIQLKRFAEQKEQIRRLWNIGEKTAMLLYFFAITKRAKNILEIGTSNGYSTFWLSLAAEVTESEIDTIEVDESRYLLACENLKERKNVNIHFGLAEKIIPSLDKKFDLVFIDAGKIDYINYIKLLLDKLENNALIIADNVISHRETVHEYLSFVRNSPDFFTFTLPVESGLEISVYKK
ncbi:MAG: hypothetical protein B6D62_03315 [Candidatus Cloacimonas sp. 4484_275]|nr:MAG: hypothetical protein B6D62_03315 [Candidatus Cloacimonas sp. 4484_275]